jgi:hypothetical protein
MSKTRGLAEVLVKIEECPQIQRVGSMTQALPSRTPAATYKMLQRIRQSLQLCLESRTKPEAA